MGKRKSSIFGETSWLGGVRQRVWVRDEDGVNISNSEELAVGWGKEACRRWEIC